MDADTLTDSLNDLLAALQLPFVLNTPHDLTPSLLLAMLESMLRTRLPISREVRISRTSADKVTAMKIFLAVLENDVLEEGFGLVNAVDPRRLAKGDWEEVVYVGDLLCVLGREMNILAQPDEIEEKCAEASESQCRFDNHVRDRGRDEESEPEEQGRPHERSPSDNSTANTSLHTALSLQHSRALSARDSDTTAPSEIFPNLTPNDSESDFPPLVTFTPPRQPTVTNAWKQRRQRVPHCIHETFRSDSDFGVSGDGLTLDGTQTSYCDCEALGLVPPTPTTPRANATSAEESSSTSPVRFNGYIEPVDEELELASFEIARQEKGRKSLESRGLSWTPHRGGDGARRSAVTGRSFITPNRRPSTLSASPSSATVVTRHTSPAQHTLRLLEERARLLDELARLKLLDT